MEKVTEQEEVFESDIEIYLTIFCEQHTPPIEDLSKESQSVWNAALMYINKHVFKGTDKLKSKTLIDNNNIPTGYTNYNAYDYNKVNDVCDIYIYLCMTYDKEISAIGFSLLTGIDRYTIATWREEGTKLSSLSSDIGKKLYDFREESLSAKLATANKNPVGILAILNRHYSWNLPGVSRESANKQALTAAELPQLGQTQQNTSSLAVLEHGAGETEQNE